MLSDEILRFLSEIDITTGGHLVRWRFLFSLFLKVDFLWILD